MSFKSKLLNILTFGHVNRKAKQEAEKLANTKNEQLTLNTMELPDISALVDGFGGIENLKEVTNTISTISFKIYDLNKVDFEQIQKLTKRGIIRSTENLTLIVGDCAKALKEKIDEYKNK